MKHLEPNLPAVPEPYRAVNPPLIVDAEYESAPAHVPLAHYLWILRRHGWKMLGFVALVVLCTVVVSLRLTPIYESTATIDIDRRMPTGVLGEDSTQSVNNDADQFLATQVKLIQSDSVLRPVVDKFKLREVEPDALRKGRGRFRYQPRGARGAEAAAGDAPAQHLHPADQLPLGTPATGGRRGQRDRAELSGALLRDPLQGHGQPERVHGAAAGRAEGQDGEIQRGAGAVRARAQPDQSGREDQHPDRAAAGAEQRVHQGARGPGAQRGGLQLGRKRVAGGGAGVESGRGAEETDRGSGRGAAEVRRRQDDVRRESSGVQEAPVAGDGTGSAAGCGAEERRAAGGGGVLPGHGSRIAAGKRGEGHQGRVRQPERAVLRISDAQARGRGRQEAVRRAGAQDPGGRASTPASRTARSAWRIWRVRGCGRCFRRCG